MTENLKSPDVLEGSARFFRRLDWSSFWTATLVSFAVYFLTAAPTVTLEDAGELVVAGDYLGVPHPPGYPIWTICAWVFARVFSFVTFRGQPNPAWAISVMSGFFAALAAGLTAMLITRTSSDMLRNMEGAEGVAEAGAAAAERQRNLLSWVAGVAGSLVFAFSPVMWSQATIPEVYTLNAFFLMWIFLLSYRWMRRPSDRVLWATAFIFGLGLTNYQVLLLAAVPLVIIIFLKELALFRDFLLTSIPFGVVMGILKLGSYPSRPGIPKHAPDALYEAMIGPPLVSPGYYLSVAAAVALVLGGCAHAAFLDRRSRSSGKASDAESKLGSYGFMAAGAALLLITLAVVPEAKGAMPEPGQEVFSWLMPSAVFFGSLAVLWVFAWFAPGGRWYAAGVTAILVALGGLLAKGALLGLTHPLTWWFWVYVLLNFVVLGMSWFMLPRGKAVALTYLFAEAGTAFYIFMPIASDRNPPMNWGYARTWEGFKHAITRGQYEKISPTDIFSPLFIRQLGSYFTDMRMQFTLVLAPLGFLPFAGWRFRVGKREINGLTLTFFAAGAVALLVILGKLGMPLDNIPRLDKALVALILLASGIGGLALLTEQALTLERTARDGSLEIAERLTAGFCLLGGAMIALFFSIGFCNAIAEIILENMGVAPPPPDASAGITRAFTMRVYAMTTLMVALIGSLTAGLITVSRRRLAGFRMSVGRNGQQWLIALLSGFLVMSLLLIALANPKGDLQDNFIQKVKFISSHGLFAVCIGYGIAFGLHTAGELLKGGLHAPRLAMIPVALALATPLIPIHENYFNRRLVDIMSSADQTGHDFGWQFGNYQLRGAEAITEELDADEEPLPNPDYPPAMTESAVFFGGTDPGRFVPTYMIYSARVRPDVYLITQNALADNTYMNTMRDLYGDEIWMPMPKDNGAAFQKYVDEVRSGERPNLGDIVLEGGRVQVTGALAVMEINGILTEQIFRKNRDRHDFYVEESYTLRWMYPFMTPHGLILKINHDETILDHRNINDDLDFWDWYTRRLLANPLYPRDLVARKSFSKLRCAIGGLYAVSGMRDFAELAFRQARALYSVGPEANLRLVQEILLPSGRFDEALQMLGDLQAADPNNARLPDMLKNIVRIREVNRRISALREKQGRPGGLGTDETLELAQSYVEMGIMQALPSVLQPLLAKTNIAPRTRFDAAIIYASGKRHKEASAALESLSSSELEEVLRSQRDLLQAATIHADAQNFEAVVKLLVTHLRRSPSDWQAWLDLATMNLRLQRLENAVGALQQALRIGGQEAGQLIQNSPELMQLYNHIRQQNPQGHGPRR